MLTLSSGQLDTRKTKSAQVVPRMAESCGLLQTVARLDRTIDTRPDSRNPADVLPRHAGVPNPNKSTARIRKAQIRQFLTSGRRPTCTKSDGVSGRLSDQSKAFLVADVVAQETLNYWKQLTHIMKYFRQEEEPRARLPKNFISGFLEVCISVQVPNKLC